MTLPSNNRDLEQASLLLQEYIFELGGFNPQELVQFWQQDLEVDAAWIRAAVLEALYQGRYKAFSVGQILQMWKRRQQSVRHFNHDFERVVFGPLDAHSNQAFVPASVITANTAADEPDAIPTMATELPYFNGPEPLPSSVEPADSPSVPFTTLSPSESAPPEPRDVSVQGQDTSASSTHMKPSEESFHTPEPIQKFVPVQQPSGFYNRLQAVARVSP